MAADKKISELPVITAVSANDVSVLVHNGTNYQYNFTSLLEFINSGINSGVAISFGAVMPANNSGKNGDLFINTSTGSFAQKTAGTWVVKYTLPSPGDQKDGTVLYGSGIPGTAIGSNNDTYINIDTGTFYKRTNNVWLQVFSMQTGPQGPKGDKGDTGLPGANGKTILSGASNPSNSTTGTDGDFYLNTTSLQLFGPKSSGVWGSGTAIVGIQGEQGEPGLQGSAGPSGATGPKGDTGSQGLTGAQGAPGPAGAKGEGVATGGQAGQVLAKATNADFDTEWVDAGGGGGNSLPSFPSVANLAHDFNFGNIASMVVDSSGKISQITDAVGGVVSSQATDNNKPVLQSFGGGANKPFAVFNGAQYLVGPVLSGVQECTIIIIQKNGGFDPTTYPGNGIQGSFQNGKSDDGYGIVSFTASGRNWFARAIGCYVPNNAEMPTDIPAVASTNWNAFTLGVNKSASQTFKFYDVLSSYHQLAGGGWGADPTTQHSIGSGFGTKFVGGIQRILFFNRELLQTEIKQINDYLIAYYQLEKPNHLVFIGDSITWPGAFASGNYPEYIFNSLRINKFLTFSNKALPGEQSTGILARLTTDVLNHYNSGVKNIFYLQIGHNDLNNMLFERIVSICKQCQEVGYKVIIATVLPTSAMTTETMDSLVNTKIRNTWAQFSDALCDIASLPNARDPNNTIYYTDGTHPTESLAHEIAIAVQPTIERLLNY